MATKGNNENDSGKEMLMAGAAVLIFVILVWYLCHGAIARAYVGLRVFEMWLIGFVSTDVEQARQYVRTIDPTTLPFTSFHTLLSETGSIVRWMFAPILVSFAIWGFFTSPLEKFKKRYTTASLLKQESKIWPEVSPVVGLDLISGDCRKGKWAVSMTEWEFAEKHKCIDENRKLIKPRTREVFTRQLGPLWTGHENLPPYAKAIFATLLLRIAMVKKPNAAKGDVEDMALMRMRQLATSFSTTRSVESLDVSWVDAAIAENINHPIVQKVLSGHAYVFTTFAMLLQVSRASGVLNSALFIWLRPTDRRLWYTMNSVGKYSFVCECGGIMAHWLAEKELKTKLIMPCIEKAVDGFEEALNSYGVDDTLERLFY